MNGDKAPHILKLGTRWRRMTASGSCHFTTEGSAPTVYEAGWAQNSCVAATEKKKYFAHVGKKLLFLTAQHS
jgi:hypothetical protein